MAKNEPKTIFYIATSSTEQPAVDIDSDHVFVMKANQLKDAITMVNTALENHIKNGDSVTKLTSTMSKVVRK